MDAIIDVKQGESTKNTDEDNATVTLTGEQKRELNEELGNVPIHKTIKSIKIVPGCEKHYVC